MASAKHSTRFQSRKTLAEKVNAIAARLRRRLKRGPADKLDPKWGRWLPPDRYSLDQVPMTLDEGDKRTYDDEGSETVWVAGLGQGDAGKRFCTLQLIARCHNGDKSKLYAEQPWPEVCFRGQGKVISKQEKDGYGSA